MQNGRIGIGTTSPYALLSLATTTNQLIDVFAISTSTSGLIFKVDPYGQTYGDGAYSSPAADYAEYFYTNSVGLKSGETVCVDILENNAVKRCERGADNNVMGIVSTKPSVIGNYIQAAKDNPSHYAIIGMLGQVEAFVSAENGAINVGDSLTSASSTPGYAMLADSGDSTVGIALEPLATGMGKIKVLISRRNKSLAVEEVEALVVERIANMKIEDSVQLMIKKSVDNLNLDPKITEIAQDEAGKLNALLTVGINDNTTAIAQLNENFTALNASNAKILSVLDISTASTTAPALYIDSLGNVRIGSSFAQGFGGQGTTTPQHRLSVAGSAFIDGSLTVRGDIAAESFINSSSRELKTDITELATTTEDTILEQLSATNVYSYRYPEGQQAAYGAGKDSSTGIMLDVATAPKEVLSVSGDGVDIYKLSVFTLAGVKAQGRKIEAIDTRLNIVEQAVAALKAAASNVAGAISSAVTGGMDSAALATSEALAQADNAVTSAFSGSMDSLVLAFTALFDGLKSLGVDIAQNLAHFVKIVADNLQVGSAEHPTGITMYDKSTGEPYCFQIDNGAATTTPGACLPVGALAESGTDTVPATTSASGSATSSPSGPAAQIAAAAAFAAASATSATDLGVKPPSAGGDSSLGGVSSGTPVIQINGNNPAHLAVGAVFGELGALIIGPTEADKNLGIHIFVDGMELEPVQTAQIDTSAPGEHTIDYVAENSFGTATSTRTVIVDAPASVVAIDASATSTAATTDSTSRPQATP